MSRLRRTITGHLPAWTQRDHPLVARELKMLPHLPVGRSGLYGGCLVWVVFLVIVGGQITSNLPVLLILIPFYLPVLLWAAPVISREVEQGTWEVLRTTPYSIHDIVLAKLSAVAHRLTPVLAVIVYGQLLPLALVVIIIVFASSISFFTGSEGPDFALMAFSLLFLVVTQITTALEYLINIAIGGLMSTLTTNRGLAYSGALALRVTLYFLYVVGFLIIAALDERSGSRLTLAAFASVTVQPGWALLMMEIDPGKTLLLAVLVVGGQAAALATILRVLFWRAERL